MQARLSELLEAGCEELGLTPNEQQIESWLSYLALLQQWNKAFNLTAVRDPREMVTRHLLDSLSVASHVSGERLIDVGTGAGLPGVPLAILYPEKQIDLLDSNGKKTRFLFQVKTSLGLDNIVIHHQRVMDFRPQSGFDLVLSRAFASLRDMVTACGHLVTPGGRFLAMKGLCPADEIAAMGDLCQVLEVDPVTVPGLSEARHIVMLALNR